MSVLSGLSNENEFYSNHYLDAIFQNDLKEVKKRWSQLDHSPPDALKALSSKYFRQRDQFDRTKDPADRATIQQQWLSSLLSILGYTFAPQRVLLDSGEYLPLIGCERKNNNLPQLWILEALPDAGETTDVLSLSLDAVQLTEEDNPAYWEEKTFEDIISDDVFGEEQPPRWVILTSMDQLVLIDRFKWNASRLLRFDWNEIFAQKDTDTLLATTTLLHREHTCPSEGTAYLDQLDENSHHHAYEVSEDLKYALRQSIERLGNEAVWYIRYKAKKGVFHDRVNPNQLTLECLRYMYRLLFIFYIEARKELGYAPMKSQLYREGYSLESLRDLEQTELRTEEDREGYFLDKSLKKLFHLIWEGYPPESEQTALNWNNEEVINDTFQLYPLKSHLFDPERLPLLNQVKFRNCVLRDIIEWMSLSREGKSKRRGRIS